MANTVKDITHGFSEEQMAKMLEDFVLNGRSIREIQGLTEEQMEAIYATAFTLYNGGRYEDAEKIFHCLCIFDHLGHRYWMGLGATRQMLKKYKDAVDAYSMAAVLDVHDPQASLHAAECHLALGNVEAAKSALTCTIQYAGSNHAAKARAEALLSFLAHNNTQAS